MSLESRIKALARARAEATAGDDACKRRSRRKATALPGLLTFEGIRTSLACTVSDMSGSGARVTLAPSVQQQFGNAEHLPARLTLILRADHLQVDCEVVWRRNGRLGLRYLGAPRPMAQPARPAAAALRLPKPSR